MKKIFTTALLLGASLSMMAGGYRVALQGVRQAGMGHTSTGFTQDASGLFFNPAMIAFSEHRAGLSANFFGLTGTNYYQNQLTDASYETDNPTGTPFQVGGYYTFKNGLTLGLNACTPYGNSVKWPSSWTGQDLVTEISLSAIYIQPSLTYQISKDLSIGASFNIVTGDINLQRNLSSVGGSMELDGKGNGYGYTVGIYGKPTEKMRWGLSYRSKVDMEANEQNASFTLPASVISATGPFKTTEDKFSATLPLVSEWTTGFSYKFWDKLTMSAEVNMAQWSQYEKLDIDFDQNLIGNDANDATLSSTPKKFRNSGTVRIGGQYDFSDRFCIRAGYYHDPSPVRSEYWSPETPSVDINAGTFGLGFNIADKMYIDLAGMVFAGKERAFDNVAANFSGDTKSDATAFGLGLSYNFNKKIKPQVNEEL